MPRSKVGRFSGYAVYGAAGAYRYDHPDGAVVWVHREEDGGPVGDQPWAVTVSPPDSSPYAIVDDRDKKWAFRDAYSWMERYSRGRTGSGSVPDARGEGSVDHEFDFGGGL